MAISGSVALKVLVPPSVLSADRTWHIVDDRRHDTLRVTLWDKELHVQGSGPQDIVFRGLSRFISSCSLSAHPDALPAQRARKRPFSPPTCSSVASLITPRHFLNTSTSHLPSIFHHSSPFFPVTTPSLLTRPTYHCAQEARSSLVGVGPKPNSRNRRRARTRRELMYVIDSFAFIRVRFMSECRVVLFSFAPFHSLNSNSISTSLV
ncbi:hypothetical protein BC826DRAFT_577026 [Russula brevipes]|nr:hypothetical protein BC826DRAFT_577026 [Russula brevipes]